MTCVLLGGTSDHLQRTLAVFPAMMKCNSYVSRLEAECGAAWMKHKVDGHEADVVDGVFVYYWAVIVTGLKALNVGCDVRASRETALINTFLVDLIAIIRSILVAGPRGCRRSHWCLWPCLSIVDNRGRRHGIWPDLVVPAIHDSPCNAKVFSSEVDILSTSRQEWRPAYFFEGSADQITHVVQEVEIWRGWQPDRCRQISARAPMTFIIGATEYACYLA